MQRPLFMRLISLWIAFGLGGLAGGWFVSRQLGSCSATLVDLDVDALKSSAQAAIPAAVTGSGTVNFSIEPTGIQVHADSAFTNQDYDARVLAVVRGSPMKLAVSTKLLRRLLGD